MASTRNKNCVHDYACEQRSVAHNAHHVINPDRRFAHSNALPCFGINMGSMPNSVLAKNATDIESRLFGVGASNLVSPQTKLTPQTKTLPFASYFERPKFVMPDPLVVEKDQRPLRP